MFDRNLPWKFTKRRTHKAWQQNSNQNNNKSLSTKQPQKRILNIYNNQDYHANIHKRKRTHELHVKKSDPSIPPNHQVGIVWLIGNANLRGFGSAWRGRRWRCWTIPGATTRRAWDGIGESSSGRCNRQRILLSLGRIEAGVNAKS